MKQSLDTRTLRRSSTTFATNNQNRQGDLRDRVDDIDAREDAFLRYGNGIRDAVVFPRLRAMGVAEADLHRAAMRLVRQVQYGLDHDGAIAAFLGVVRCYPRSHGTIAASEVL